MNTNHSSLIRGLNVAVTVLAALSLITCVVALAAIGASKDYLYDAIAEEYYDGDLDYYEYDYGFDYGYGLGDLLDDDWGGPWHDGHGYDHPHHAALSASAPQHWVSSPYGAEDPLVALEVGLAILDALLIWEIIVSAVSLLFGILGMVNAGKPQKLGQIMGIGIAGAVVSFLGGHIILVALFIISAVMANKDKA